MRFFLLSLLLCFVLSCSQTKNKRNKLIDFAPKNSQFILRTSNIESLKSNINNNQFLNSFIQKKHFGIAALQYLSPETEVLFCTSTSDNDSIHHTLITKYSESLFKTDSLQNYSEELLKFKTFSIKKSSLEQAIFYHTVIDSTFILSTSKDIVFNAHTSEKNSIPFKKLYEVADEDQNLSVIVNTKHNNTPAFFLEDALDTEKLTDGLVLDIEIAQNDIILNGIATAIDSSKHIIDIFENTIPQENQIQHITPGNSDGVLSFTFDDFQTFKNNLDYYHGKDSTSASKNLFSNINEIGVIYQGETRVIVLSSVDVIATQDALLGEQEITENYRDVDILKFSKSTLFSNALSPFVTQIEPTTYCIINNFFVFANTTEHIQNIIANYQNKTTLSSRTYYKAIKSKLSNESSLILVAKPELLKKINTKNNGNALNLKDYSISAIQFIYDSNFAHIHGGIIKAKTKQAQHSISEEFNVKLSADLLNNPQFVKNHITQQKDIVVQDINNVLYLISNKGRVLWKKRLNGPVLGKISQVDMYKNGRLQLAFATPKRIYILDRKGRDVSPFPLRFNDDITQPLSIFDYDKNKKYRLLATQGKHVLMYDIKGKIVKGFTFKSAKSNIISQPKHFRIGTKDYLVIKTENKLYILDRIGKTRVTPKTNSSYSKEPVFLYQNKFTTTTKDGKLTSIDSRGNVAFVNLNLSTNHALETTSKTRVTLHENKLAIKSRILDLDYGNYSRPHIFYLNDKIYVAVTDLQSKKAHLFDSQGKSIPNFPVYGNSPIQLDNIDEDKNIEFVVKGNPNTVMLYQIN